MALEPAGEADRSRNPPLQHEPADPGSPVFAALGSAECERCVPDAPRAAPSRRLPGALLLALKRGLAAARRAPAEALAAAGIGAAALALALLAGDGDAVFPRLGSDAPLLSQSSVSADAEALPASMDPEALAEAALAGRLVEDPDFARRPPKDDQATIGPADVLPPPLEAPAGQGEPGEGSDPLAVLSAASPPPADPALRVLERLRAQQSPSPPAAPLPAPTVPGSAPAAVDHGVAIQLVAVGRREQAERAWARLRRENLDLLGRLRPIIVEPERRAGALFRLRAGPVASLEDGRALCAALSGRGVDCIVVQGG